MSYPYTTQTEIQIAIPMQALTMALDDDGDGAADTGLLDSIIDQASRAVDGYLSGLFTVPFTAIPSAVKQAAFVFSCELIYSRRPIGETQNPFTKQAEAWRTRLALIGSGKQPLDASAPVRVSSVRIVTEPMLSEGGSL